ncbi:efflux RND transporter periplasmic adaptor subunit [Neptuniibacter marinus]|jgi:RND family efflux transporter MFP subunit|uniref:efflux RND transporter periplasmic adaptor subunit n=1 Tax=Neptuniibacter marinus TaxID=1806670 RepID=UPI00082E0580|nr:efflux RND transporter periplasmic adaptor subunit [Neptuniibacter marinus]
MKLQILPLVISSMMVSSMTNVAFAGENHEEKINTVTNSVSEMAEHKDHEGDHEEHEGEDDHQEHEGEDEHEEHEEHEIEDIDHAGHEGEEEHKEEEHKEEEGVLHLTPEQQSMIDLEVTELKQEYVANTQNIYGEVVNNRYKTSIISAQSDVKVIRRHAVLGDHVKKGDPLVTLFSDELADRFTELRNNAKEWELVKSMGKSLSGKQRYSRAEANFRQSVTKVIAFGLSTDEIEAQVNKPNKNPLGQFILKAPHSGIIQQDNFLIGQTVTSNESLFTLVDEQDIWVEAQLPADQQLDIEKGTEITLTVGDESYHGTLLQIAHNLSEVTRTRMVRISVDNRDHRLHPGQFARVFMPTETFSLQMVLPETSFTKTPDGDWGVFVQVDEGEYKLEEVEILGEMVGSRIVSGLGRGTKVVTSGTFFLASEQAKAGFDIHNH